MKVGVLGSGDVARTLGTGFVATGHEVKLGTAHPDRAELAEWLKKAGPRGSVGTFADAAAYGEVLVLAIRGVAAPETIRNAGTSRFDGKVVLDVTNPIAVESGGPPRLAPIPSGSNGEAIQSLLPHARVVKVFNIIGHAHMYHPTFPGGPPDMYVCGNDAAAKATVSQILAQFGWPSVIDIGGIEGARELEALCILWVKSGLALRNWDIAFKLLRK